MTTLPFEEAMPMDIPHLDLLTRAIAYSTPVSNHVEDPTCRGDSAFVWGGSELLRQFEETADDDRLALAQRLASAIPTLNTQRAVYVHGAILRDLLTDLLKTKFNGDRLREIYISIWHTEPMTLNVINGSDIP